MASVREQGATERTQVLQLQVSFFSFAHSEKKTKKKKTCEFSINNMRYYFPSVEEQSHFEHILSQFVSVLPSSCSQIVTMGPSSEVGASEVSVSEKINFVLKETSSFKM